MGEDWIILNDLHIKPGSIIHSFAEQLRVIGYKGAADEVRISNSHSIINQHIDLVVGSPLLDAIMEHAGILITIFEPIDFCLLLKEGSIVITDTLQLLSKENFFVCKVLIRKIIVELGLNVRELHLRLT